MKFLIITSNKTKHILPAFHHQFEKYVPDDIFDRQVIDLEDEPVTTWTQNVYKRVKDIQDEFVVLSLDDFLIVDKFHGGIFGVAVAYMEEHENVGRYELGWGALKMGATNIDTLLFKYGQTTPYRVSCQISVWRTEYLLKFLSQGWSVWDFEVKGSALSNNDGVDIIGTRGSYALRWIEESALSARHPDMINLMGMRIADVLELIDGGLVDGNSVQFGMARGGKYDVGMLDVLNIGDKYKEFYV